MPGTALFTQTGTVGFTLPVQQWFYSARYSSVLLSPVQQWFDTARYSSGFTQDRYSSGFLLRTGTVLVFVPSPSRRWGVWPSLSRRCVFLVTAVSALVGFGLSGVSVGGFRHFVNA